MYHFLCLLGPGVLTWLAYQKCFMEKKNGYGNCLVMIYEIIVFTFLNMIMTMAVLKLFGRNLVVVLPKGTIEIQYGVLAAFVSAGLSPVIGIGVFSAEKIINRKAINSKFKPDAYILWCVITVLLFFRHLMQGFRWPSDYVLTNHVISCRFGWVPRSFIGTLGTVLFGGDWYCRGIMEVFIMGTAMVFILWFLVESIAFARCRNFAGMMVLFIFACSPYAAYYLHEMGYYEQYGYAIGIVQMYILQKVPIRKNIFVSAVTGFIVLLISESNMFLIVPAFFAGTFIRIVNDGMGTNIKKELGFLVGSYIPHVVYCIFVWVYKIPESLVWRLNEYDRERVVEFMFRGDVYSYLCDRSPEEAWPRMLHEIPGWCVVYPLLLITFVAVILYCEKGLKLMVSYAVMAVGVGICAYALVIVAWDLHRFYFCIFMNVFLFTMFVAKKYLMDMTYRKSYMYMAGVIGVLTLFICSNRFGLFDGAQYNETMEDFLITVTSRF